MISRASGNPVLKKRQPQNPGVRNSPENFQECSPAFPTDM